MKFKRINTFSPNDSNTIDDITGFKRKLSAMKKRWDGFYTDQGFHPRQPQDFPVTPIKQTVYKNVRTEQVEANSAVTAPDII